MEGDAAECLARGDGGEPGILRPPMEDSTSHTGASAVHQLRTCDGAVALRSEDAPDWFICGGQDGGGKKSIMMDPQWARDLRDACAMAGIAFFLKQMTNRASIPDDLMVREHPIAERRRDRERPA
jgi:hypothetical protein